MHFFFFEKTDRTQRNCIHELCSQKKVAKHSKNYFDGEFVKECLLAMAEIFCPKSMFEFNLFCRTITRLVKGNAAGIKGRLTENKRI